MQNFNFNLNSLNKLTSPMQQIMELNQKTMRKFSYMEPGEITQIRDPKALLEKNMQIFIENGHAGLDYMHELFNIMGDSWINLSNEAGERTKDMMQRTQSATSSAINKMSQMESNASPEKRASHSSRRSASGRGSHTSKQGTSRSDSHKNKSSSSSTEKKDDSHRTE